jgi:hypothetical protein
LPYKPPGETQDWYRTAGAGTAPLPAVSDDVDEISPRHGATAARLARVGWLLHDGGQSRPGRHDRDRGAGCDGYPGRAEMPEPYPTAQR